MDNEKDRDENTGQEKNEQQYIRQTIKGKPISKKTAAARFAMVCILAAVAAVIAAFVFVFTLPIAERVAGHTNNSERVEILKDDSGSDSISAESEETVMEVQSDSVETSETAAGSGSGTAGSVTDIVSAGSSELTIEQYVNMQNRMMDIAAEAERSLVTVSAISSSMDYFNNQLEKRTQTSGIIAASTGEAYYIVCLSSIFNNIERIQVTFNDGYITDAIYQKNDPNTGLAVLKINASEIPEETGNNIKVAELADTFSVSTGDTVIAMGSPNGYGNTVSFGRITSTENIIYCFDSQYNLLVTDIIGSAKGSGVLVDLNGVITGILNPAVTMSGSSVVSGIAMSQLKPMLEKLSNNETIPYIGIKTMEVTGEVSDITGIPEGLLATSVAKDSPAFYAGITVYDVIVMINESKISTINDYKTTLDSLESGQTVSIKVLRKGAEGYAKIEFTVEIGELE